MKATRLWVLAAMPFALAACGGGDDADQTASDTTTAAAGDSGVTITPAPSAAPTDTAMHGAQGMGAAVAMNAVGNSGVTGTAQIMDHGQGQTMVTVNLSGQGSRTHSGHIHQGTCDSPGQVVAPLQDVTLANGTGTSTTTVSVGYGDVMNGQHIVAYHTGSGANPGAPAVCGQIPAQQTGGSSQAM